jgi:hypothetical protein
MCSICSISNTSNYCLGARSMKEELYVNQQNKPLVSVSNRAKKHSVIFSL